MKGIYIMNKEPFPLVYPDSIRSEIRQLIDIDRDVMSAEEVESDLSVLKDVDVIFSGWGGPKLDDTFLRQRQI
ncbi:hypothetical protein J416_06540 [Gracilibacillus halophilus YIM-C55.5]|uniref:Uncharacterized protein n=1 Tax=Gracilibacillus halophilus YIM-C55.5 TaxID=1308866 RepID=N4WAD0_9BACI|nr:hypothetical protein [Gracilibacillus halophilus]ENH97268.1 hypothetical protein J416_06540 [Gracilibacillus halophilus YIM-C55.5]